jgi:hypothetical protein
VVAKSADQARQQTMETWQSQIIPPTATISSGVSSGVTTNPSAVDLYRMTPAERQQIAETLKNAGYKVKVTGVFNDNLVAQWGNAKLAAQMQAQSLGQTFNDDFFKAYIANETAANAAGAGGAGGDFQRKQISNVTEAASLINAVLQDAVGRKATAAEIKKYTSALQKAQAANPLKFTDTAGAGYTQQGGIDAQEYLVQQIAGTDEAKANQVLGFYDAFKNALGVK